jgi:hypothetical protein
VESYGDGVRRFLARADGECRPAVLDRAGVDAFTADLLEAGGEPAAFPARQLALRRWSLLARARPARARTCATAGTRLSCT